MKTQIFYFEYTDLFNGECNYSWIRRYRIKASSTRGAVNILSKYLRVSSFRFDGGFMWVSRSGNTGFYEIEEHEISYGEERLNYIPINF